MLAREAVLTGVLYIFVDWTKKGLDPGLVVGLSGLSGKRVRECVESLGVRSPLSLTSQYQALP